MKNRKTSSFLVGLRLVLDSQRCLFLFHIVFILIFILLSLIIGLTLAVRLLFMQVLVEGLVAVLLAVGAHLILVRHVLMLVLQGPHVFLSGLRLAH